MRVLISSLTLMLIYSTQTTLPVDAQLKQSATCSSLSNASLNSSSLSYLTATSISKQVSSVSATFSWTSIPSVCTPKKIRREKGQVQYYANVVLKVDMKLG
jgi:hypothetical protein